MRASILLVADPEAAGPWRALLGRGGDVRAFGSAAEALAAARGEPDCALVDLRPAEVAAAALRRLRATWPALTVVVATGAPTPPAVAAALWRDGAFDCLESPPDLAALEPRLARAVAHARLEREVRLLRAGRPREGDYRRARDAWERRYLEALLEEAGGAVARAAELAGLHRSTLYDKLARFGLVPPDGDGARGRGQGSRAG